jgi:integrase
MEAAQIVPPVPVRRKDRVLSTDELRRLLPVLAAADADGFGKAARFVLLTACRRQEACAARWHEIDFAAAEWSIPAARMKSGRPHVVPLSRQGLELLRGEQAMRNPRADGLLFTTATGAALTVWTKGVARLHRLSGTSGWSLHDARRTSATVMGELGIEPHAVEAALGHASIHSVLASTYNMARYKPAVAVALQRLADRFDAIASGTPPATEEIVSLPRKAS